MSREQFFEGVPGFDHLVTGQLSNEKSHAVLDDAEEKRDNLYKEISKVINSWRSFVEGSVGVGATL